MGAWSPEPFGNDTANDWAYDLDNVTDLSYIEKTIDRALEAGAKYLGVSDAEEAIAAVEVLAHLMGKPTQQDSYTAKVETWVRTVKAKPNPALRNKARQLLQRVISEESELQELWNESDEANDWQKTIQKLRRALET